MILRLAVCPSFSGDGFAVELSEQLVASVSSAGANQDREPSYVIKTKGLGGHSIVSAAQLESLFSPLRTSQTLAPADAAPLRSLVRAVQVGIPSQSWVTCDGIPTSLSIHCGDLLLALEWNPEPPSEWLGVSELAAYVASLYPLYRLQPANDRNA